MKKKRQLFHKTLDFQKNYLTFNNLGGSIIYMSKQNAKILLKDVGEFSYPKSTIRFLPTYKEFIINCLDYFEFSQSGSVQTMSYRISEKDLIRMIEADEYEVYDKVVYDAEKDNLDDETFDAVSMCQYFNVLSKRTILLVKRHAHLRKLNKVSSPSFELKPRVLHSNGGRPIGTKKVRNEWNIAHYDEIAKNCVEKEWYQEFKELNRDIGETNVTKIKWKYKIMRYLHIGIKNPEYEAVLKEKDKKYNINIL